MTKKLLSGWEELGYTKEQWECFSKSKRWRIRNPGKQKIANDNWVAANPERRRKTNRAYFLKRDYNITEDDYQLMLSSQKGLCGICKTDKPTGKWKVFAVDHCHVTGRVRGLLCNECNRGIGLLKDSSDLLRDAADYLDKHQIKTNEERKQKDD